MAAREYRLERSWVVMYQVFGFIALALAVFLLSHPLVTREFPGWPAGGLGAVALAVAFWWLLSFRPSTYAVELSEDGVRRPADGKFAPWSSLATLSERVVGQRVDILDVHGERFASLHYRLKSFPDALEQTLAALPSRPSQEDTFRRSIRVWQILPMILVVGICGSAVNHGERGILLPALLVAAAVYTTCFDISSVTVAPEGIILRHVLRTTRIGWTDVAAVHFALRPVGRGNRVLDVRVTAPSGSVRRVRPQGADPFGLYARIDTQLRSSRVGESTGPGVGLRWSQSK